MRLTRYLPGAIALTLGLALVPGRAAADAWPAAKASQPAENAASPLRISRTRTAGWSRYYGYPVYRCRRFSFQCRYYRRVHTVWHWRYSETVAGPVAKPAARRKAGPNAVYDGRNVTAYQSYGGFIRISAPGRATRWVRATDVSMPNVPAKEPQAQQ